MEKYNLLPLLSLLQKYGKIFFFSFLLLQACGHQKKEKQDSATADTSVEWVLPTFNFGKIIAGETVMHSFYFKNTGNENLIIRNIETSCGCTTADYPKQPVAPGKEGKIEIAFNSSGRYGKQYKEIRIFANVPEKVMTLKFTADIKE